MRKRSASNSPYLAEVRKKKFKILKKKILIYSLVFLAVFAGLSFLLKWKKINIDSMEITGNEITDGKAVEEAIREELSGKYLWFFPKTNFLIYPRGKVATRLSEEFKIFTDIQVNLKGLQTLSVEVTERKGKYTWCGNEIVAQTDASYKCYFMDEDGYIFDEAPYFSGDVYLKFFGQVLENAEVPLGLHFFPEFFSKLLVFHDNLEKMGIKASSVLIKNDGDAEFYLSSNANLPEQSKVIFKTNSDFEKMIENLQTALTTEPLQTNFKKKYSSLESIDLRFGNKVYYKFK